MGRAGRAGLAAGERTPGPAAVCPGQPPKGTTGFEIDATSADSSFFGAAGLTLLDGRVFNSADVVGRA